MKRKRYYQLNHTFDPCPFEVFCSGTWKAVEYLRVESGSMTMRLFENGHVLDDVKPFQKLRLRSRKATTIDCTTFLRHGVDVCVLYQKDEVTPEDDLEPVWVDAKIVSIERKPHEPECLCEFHVSIYIDQGCISSEKHRMNRASVVMGLDQISILQKFPKEQSVDRFYRWRYSEDSASLVKTRLTLGKFMPDLSWLLVTSVLKNSVFHIKTIQNKMVYLIMTDEESSSSSCLSAMNITVEDGVYLSKVVTFNPDEDDTTLALDYVHVEEEESEEEEEVMELRRSKRRNMRPDRYGFSGVQPDSKDGWVRLMPYKYSTWTDDEEGDDEDSNDDRDSDDDLYLPLSHFFGKESNTKGFSKRKESEIVLVDKTARKKKMKMKKRDGSGGSRELSVIPFTPVFDPIPLEQFGFNANSLCNGGFSGSNLIDEMDRYRSKPSKYGKKKMLSEMDEMESDLGWIDNMSKSSVQKGTGSHSRIRSGYGKTGHSDEPQIFKRRTLSAGAYNKLIESYMSNIDSTIAAKKETNSVVEQWEALKNPTSTTVEDEDGSSEDDDSEGETSENEMLWREMELCMASSYILDDNELRVDNEAFQKATSGCEHDYELNEEIGMCCKLCGHVGSEIRDVSAPFARQKKWTTEAKHINEEDIDTNVKQDGDERRSFTMPVATSEVPSPEESENVWSLIPQLRRKLHMHQKKAFEFLWRNLAGSVVPSMMDPSSDKIGGCVVSHTPGAGKTFLIIAFLASYLKIFPGKRPLVLAPNVFPRDYRSKLATKSLRIQIEPFLDKAKGALDYLTRVSFGTALIASIVIVYTSIILLLSSRSEDDNRQRRRGRGYDSGFNFYFNPVDLFWYWDPNYYRRRRAREDEGKGMNFVESVFSFVFGDGDPNQGIEEERWQMIGRYITARGGVVAADELAPYLDVPSSKNATSDESYILPVLLRFDGQPELDEEGNILYRFPSLQRTALGSSRRKEYVGKWFDWVADMEKFFKEKKWQFSKTSSTERAMVIGLGAVNLFGVIVLNTLLKEMAFRPSGFITFVKNIYPLLQVYAGSFFVIPLVRWLSVKRKNDQIENRNKARLQFARALESPDVTLRRKLVSARDMAQNTVIGKERIVYSTERDMIEQDYEAEEWDRRFREVDKSE